MKCVGLFLVHSKKTDAFFLTLYVSDISSRYVGDDKERHHPCCFYKKSEKTKQPNFVQYIQKIKSGGADKLIICGNLDGNCTVLAEADFDNAGVTGVQLELQQN